MSYFFAAVDRHFGEIENRYEDEIGTIFSEFTNTCNKACISANNVFVVNYFQKKVIKDVYIKHESSDSWLLLIGMPILKGKYKEDLQGFMSRFLGNCREVIDKEVDGHFVLFAYDSLRKKFVVSTDINNFIPVFYVAQEHRVLFCSSEIALAKLLHMDIDPMGFSQGIHLGATWGSISRFKGIERTNPCDLLSVNENIEIHKDVYWKPLYKEIWKGRFDEVLDNWMSILRNSVLTLYESSINRDTVWVDLTGGEDARLLVAQCYSLGLPFKVRVGGFPGKDIDFALNAAQQADIDLIIDPYSAIKKDHLIENAKNISLSVDGYGSFFYACMRYASNIKKRPLVFDFLHLSGVPGGEAFRGTYYARAKLLLPTKQKKIDYKFFAKMKYLLNFYPNLFEVADHDFLEVVYANIRESLLTVEEFPAGLKVDHLLREFQTCLRGSYIKRPFYLPLGMKQLTESIYALLPHHKRGGRITKACTELLFPKLAFAKTVNHIPTIRRSLGRSHLFLPEYYAFVRKLGNGFTRRFIHARQSSKTLSAHHRLDLNSSAMCTVMNNPPYNKWFTSSKTMITGYLYNGNVLDKLLLDARNGTCNYVEVMGRIINQEMACRYIYNYSELTP